VTRETTASIASCAPSPAGIGSDGEMLISAPRQPSRRAAGVVTLAAMESLDLVERPAEKVYRRGLAAGVGAGLAAALMLAVIDIVRSGGWAAAGQLLGLWLAFGLLFGAPFGLFLGAGNATFGSGFVRRGFARLAAARDTDLAVSGALVAGLVVSLPTIAIIGRLSVVLVGNVERKPVGGLLLGVVVVAMLPLLAAAALPVFRVTRRLVRYVPHSSRTPAAAVLLIFSLAATLAIGAFVLFTRLDWRALHLGSLLALVALPGLALGLAGFTSRLSASQPAPLGISAVVLALLSTALPVLSLRGPPMAEVSRVVLDRSWIGPRAIAVLRALSDADGDGESAFFGGPDCDDHNPAIRSTAPELPGNGIDDNCLGGDAKAEDAAGGDDATAAGDPTKDPVAPAAPVRADAFGGNVLIIFVDTLRYDRLGFAGYRRDGKTLTPRLDALAAQSVVFRNTFAQAPNTPRSVPSFLSSRYPSQIKFEKNFVDYPTVLDDNDLMFEALRGAGLHTAAVTSHFYFCDQTKAPAQCADFKKPKHSNVRQGVDEWDNEGAVDIAPSNKDISAPRIVPRAIAKLDELARSKQRFAMMVHFFEPHSTYVEHEGWPITERGTAGLEQKYDYEIAFTDQWIGKLLDALEASKLADDTMVVVIADHGEAFGTHSMAGERMFFHGQTLYNELIHVPMMFRLPGAAPRVADDVVQLIDLAPTIVDVIGGTAPKSWQGRSLRAALAGEALPPRPAFAQLLPAPAWNHDARAMISGDGNYKVYFRKSDSRWEIYDLKKDPKETKDLSETAPNAAELKQELTSWIERVGG
jgi:arylsulfatase A-like enzyme